jgi:uncharacterized protein (DUF169 family)
LEILKRFKKAVDEHLSLRSLPIAVKLLEREEDVPPNMGRPMRDLGESIRPCQGWHLARHKGLSVAMLEEDFTTACPAGLFVFGILEPTQSWIDGGLSYGIYAASLEAAANMERHVYRLKAGKYKGVAFTPLGNADFTPDLIMIFCNSNDARRLALAAAWETGEPLKVNISGRDLCAESIAQPIQTGRPVLAIPCGGDREYGMTDDYEIVFSIPVDKLEVIIKGLEESKKSQSVEKLGGLSKLRERYKEMAKILDEKLGR